MMARVEQSMPEAIERFSLEALMGPWLSALPQGSDWVQRMFASAVGNKTSTER
jgi:hypothetical protein